LARPKRAPLPRPHPVCNGVRKLSEKTQILMSAAAREPALYKKTLSPYTRYWIGYYDELSGVGARFAVSVLAAILYFAR
jgi:hypothetical protein